MKKITLVLVLINTIMAHAQVGINTTSPATGSQLDIYSSTKGLLIPRVSLNSTTDNTTITPAATTGLLVYNTNSSGGVFGVSPGFYYRLGSLWVRIQDNHRFWSILGNNQVVAGDFIGTTNNRQIDFKTNNTNRLRIPQNSNRLLAMSNGFDATPFYTWNDDYETGMWLETDDVLALGADRTEYVRFSESSNDLLVINSNNESINTVFRSQDEDYMLFIDNDNDRLGIKTDNPQTVLHLAENTTLRIDELNQTNNIYYVSNDPMPIYVNTDGDLQLRPPLVQNFMPVNAVDFTSGINFIANGLGYYPSGGTLTQNIYSTSLNLSQESVVYINYQISIQISRRDMSLSYPIIDGAPRKYSAWVEVNGNSTKLAFDSDMYTNMPIPDSGGTYAAGYYYLSGTACIQLPAGNHSFVFRGQTQSATDQPYYIRYGETPHDRFQLIVHR